MEFTERRLRTADVELRYLDSGGDLPVIVMLHGLAGDAHELVATARALPEFRSVLVDLRAHGASTRNPTDVSRAAFTRDAVLVLEAIGCRVTLLGHSMGGHTAMLAAAARPDLVERLVLLESGPGGEHPAGNKRARAYFRSWPLPFPDEQTAVAFFGDSSLAGVWLAALQARDDGLWPPFDPMVMDRVLAGMGIAYWQEWERMTTPTLVVYAEHGMFTPSQKNEFIDRGQTVVRVDLAGASHDAHLDSLDVWTAALRTFLLRQPAPQSTSG